ncbi:replicative DNA helicase [Paenibacillus selenitireducens]|uniref:Replicative DNA helicase n=1 Tax=Paenibacillus selenitireducens TaxID=1324314 RepID=A0A1T2XAY5_9BACL|nr:replicative DNA helicase [Paenibacillus selenitireducens]OPA76763.1 replicative DNA helicase [Paenibacillus selenitireducens]
MKSFDSINAIELPESPEAEQAVLGAMLVDETYEALRLATDTLKPMAFANQANRFIFEAANELVKEDEPIDFVTLTSRLTEKQQLEDTGGPSYLLKLAQSVPSVANVQSYIETLNEKYMLREIIRSNMLQIRDAMENGNVKSLLASMQNTATKLSDQAAPKQEFKRIKDVVIEVFDDMEHRYENRDSGGVTGLPSGFTDLDVMTAGFQNSDLIIVAARPSVGKTAFALNVAQNVAVKIKETVAIFSLEMGAKQLVQRMVSAEGDIDASKMRTGRFESNDWVKASEAIGALGMSNIVIDDSPTITVNDIRNKCRRLKREEGLGMIVIDYLQLIASVGRGTNRQEEVSHISRILKQIARELEVPVIALSQLSRSVEQRQDKRPMMSDLRESGSIEQDADVIAFLYRDDYYDKESEKKNIIEIIIGKQRNGPVGTVELVFLKQYNKFVNHVRSQRDEKPNQEKQNNKKTDKRKWA